MKTPDTRWGRTLLIVSVVIGSACLVSCTHPGDVPDTVGPLTEEPA